MTRTASDSDLYRQFQTLQSDLRQQQQGLLQGAFNPFIYLPCDYATTGNVVLANVFTSITDVAAGSPTLGAFGGMRILVWQQTNKIENGIYEVGTDNYLRRAADMPDSAIVKGGARIYVRNGTASSNRDFIVQGSDKVIGTSALLISPPKGTTILEGLRGSGPVENTYTPVNVTWTNLTDSNGVPVLISYTPPVDVAITVFGQIYFNRLVANYSYAYVHVWSDRLDVDGNGQPVYGSIMGGLYNGVVNYATVTAGTKLRLAAGLTYNISLQYWCDSNNSIQRGKDWGSYMTYEAKVR